MASDGNVNGKRNVSLIAANTTQIGNQKLDEEERLLASFGGEMNCNELINF